ncbi:dihydropteroate synthase [Desulfonatronovibrio magnus]|uniref:dihydropteroate synthase n=1 Tax=Desulfonatronovibrio magnus TaxID=698827 RepID=UPI001E46522B|nr:dihydropteroate synthase [Desulfonatronovibrio magnus]
MLNVTPDSFYDGGKYDEHSRALDHATAMLKQGADIIDAGGESTRPFSEPVNAQTELARVLPVISDVLLRHPDARVSVDTYKASVASACLEAGASIVNDVSACRFDPGLMDVIVQYKPGYVLMHSSSRPQDMQKNPIYSDVVDQIKFFFQERLNALTAAGMNMSRIVLDPGIGFGKTLEHNLEILKRVNEFLSFGLPLYLGVSNKSLWGTLSGLKMEERGTSTQVAVALTALKGVGIHRVHDVPATVNTLKILRKIWY